MHTRRTVLSSELRTEQKNDKEEFNMPGQKDGPAESNPYTSSHVSRTERKVELTEEDIKRFYNCPQPVAALLLGCSLSSLYVIF
jgi:hypothetical protein